MLQQRITDLVTELKGTAGIVVRDLSSGEGVGVNADQEFPAASVIKLGVLWQLFQAVEAGRVKLDDRLPLPEARDIQGSGILREMHSGLMPTVQDVAILMIIISDDVATNMLIDLLGLAEINAALQALGLTRTRLGRKMMSPQDAIRVPPSSDNVMSPADAAYLLEAMLRSERASKNSRRQMLEILQKQRLNDRLPVLLPKGLVFPHKTGSLPGVVNDAGILFLGIRPIAMAVLTKELKDNRDGVRLANRVGEAVYMHFAGPGAG
jgi:beta-lactamase class A